MRVLIFLVKIHHHPLIPLYLNVGCLPVMVRFWLVLNDLDPLVVCVENQQVTALLGACHDSGLRQEVTLVFLEWAYSLWSAFLPLLPIMTFSHNS